MKKEDLIALGVAEEAAAQVMDAWTEAIKDFVPRARLDEVSKELKSANKTIGELKEANRSNEALQQKVTAYEGEIAQLKADAEVSKKTAALKEKLAAAGLIDPEYVIFKRGGVDKFSFDKEGAPVGVEDTVKALRDSAPHLFKKQGYEPAGGGGAPVKNPWAKDALNLTEQGRIFRENPAQARELAAAAGVQI